MALFFPGGGIVNATAVDSAVLAASLPTTPLQAILPVITHLAALPAIAYAWRIRAYRALAAILNSFIVSSLYHACQSWPAVACMGLDLSTYRMNDYIWSPYVMAVGVEFLLRLYVYPWSSLVSLPYLALIVFATLSNPFSIYAQLLIVAVAALLLFIKTAFLDLDSETAPLVDTGGNRSASSPRSLRIDVPHRFHVLSLLMGAALIGISLVGFIIDDANTYWLTHAILWHIPIYLSLYFIMVGSTRDVRGWYSPFAVVCHETPDTSKREATEDPPMIVYSAPTTGEHEFALDAPPVATVYPPRYASTASRLARLSGQRTSDRLFASDVAPTTGTARKK